MAPELWEILILAVVQGVTEFLPISSSGHVVVVAALLSPDNPAALEINDLNIVLHVGTLISILVFYWQRVLRLLGEDRRLIGLLVIGTVPAVALGLPLKFFGENILSSALVAGALLPLTGLMLIWVSRRQLGERDYTELHWREALEIGCFQAAAILPGLSRSGTTITAGLLRGLQPGAAATFSFLLAIPAIAGGGVLQLVKMLSSPTPLTTPIAHLAMGLVVSFLVGLISLHWLVRWLERGRLQWFALWCIPFGLGIVIWRLVSLGS